MSLWDGVRRVPREPVCFVLVTLAYLVHLFASGYDRFYYDAEEYWRAGQLFGRDGGFSLLAYDYEWRGYSTPLLYHVLDVVGSAAGLGAVAIVKIFGALLAATLGVVVLPRLARALFSAADVSWGRVLALNGLIFLFWRDHFGFPLADFPALLAASVGVIALLRATTGGYLVAGLSLGLAANMRGNYWFALLAGLAVVALIPWHKWNWRPRGAAVCLVLAGALVASLPQVLVNHRHHDTWSPSIPIANEQNLVTTWIGMRAQKYETFVGSASDRPQGGVSFVDPALRRLLAEEGIEPVTRLGRASFPSNTRYLQLLAEHPVEMAAGYVRHLLNGLDVKYPTPYVRNLDDTSVVLSLLQYTLLFLALARLIVPEARKALGRVRWAAIVVLLAALVGILATHAEVRYYLPATVLVYMLVCFGPDTRSTLFAGSRGRRLALAGSYAAFVLLYLTFSSTTRGQIELDPAAASAESRRAMALH